MPKPKPKPKPKPTVKKLSSKTFKLSKTKHTTYWKPSKFSNEKLLKSAKLKGKLFFQTVTYRDKDGSKQTRSTLVRKQGKIKPNSLDKDIFTVKNRYEVGRVLSIEIVVIEKVKNGKRTKKASKVTGGRKRTKTNKPDNRGNIKRPERSGKPNNQSVSKPPKKRNTRNKASKK